MDDTVLVDWYLTVKEQLICGGFADEIDLQWDRDLSSVTEQQFLAESAWVVINSGFRESTARRIFPHIASAFGQWAQLDIVIENLENCREQAFRVFRHQGKIDAICVIAKELHCRGLQSFLDPLIDGRLEVLCELPYIGEVTGLHLAKNLGAAVCKPDRHLCRLADRLGCASAHELCTQLSHAMGERVDVIDSVLWRYLSLGGHPPDIETWRAVTDRLTFPVANTSFLDD